MKSPILLFCLLLVSCSQPTVSLKSAETEDKIAIAPREKVQATGKRWMISTQGKYASDIANSVMKQGGNLMDAAIAASFAISVERPQSTGIGGGGFLIYHEAKSGKNYAFDFRERAPLKANRDMYLNHQGEAMVGLSTDGSLAVGTPGLVKGLVKLHERFGRVAWKKLIQPSIELARNGFEVYPHLAKAIQSRRDVLNQFPSSRAIFLHADGSPKVLGEKLVQADLAKTLERITFKKDDLYSGETASKLVETMKKYQGLVSRSDLHQYQVHERKVMDADWLGYHIISMPPPSSGGVHVIQILKLLERDPLNQYGFLSSKSLHFSASAMQLAFADRAVYLGDPDFTKVPLQGLLDVNYLAQRRAQVKDDRALTMKEVSAGKPEEREEEANTTHFSMMDEEGNVVVSTQTINGAFGSGLVAEGTGIVLNNEMDDFSIKPGTANLFGAVGGDANAIAPKKTPLSSMSPTIVMKNKMPLLALGAPGGTRIITSVAQTILNYFVYHRDLYQAVAAPRIHQQWTPDVLSVEQNSSSTQSLSAREEISPQTLQTLEKMGWKIKRVGAQSNIMAVAREEASNGVKLTGVSDPRDIGTSAGE